MQPKEIKSLIQQFDNRPLPLEKWTHQAHLIVALWYIKKYNIAEATCLLRSGIISYNVAVGTKNTPSSGYHETITLFWIILINKFVENHKGLKISKLTELFLNSRFAEKTIFFEFYTKDTLFSTEARANWVAPDIKPI